MPFTPFHLGPALPIKSFAPRSFSLLIFAASQVAIDIEVVFHLWRDHAHIHQHAHTFLGATIIALILWFLFSRLSPHSHRTVLVSSFLGTYSHIILDCFMHSDMAPFYPLSAYNPILGFLDATSLCLYMGMIGVAFYCLKILKCQKVFSQ